MEDTIHLVQMLFYTNTLSHDYSAATRARKISREHSNAAMQPRFIHAILYATHATVNESLQNHNGQYLTSPPRVSLYCTLRPLTLHPILRVGM